MSARYRLPDEPRPGGLSHLVVHPIWPLLAIMTCGPALAWPWFALNGWALGSPTRVRETLVAIGGFLGNLASLLLIGVVVEGFDLPEGTLPYLLILASTWKLGITYALLSLQERPFGVYSWFGGTVRNGALVAIAGGLLARRSLASALAGSPLLSWVLL